MKRSASASGTPTSASQVRANCVACSLGAAFLPSSFFTNFRKAEDQNSPNLLTDLLFQFVARELQRSCVGPTLRER
jgi:hypothetical protein